MTHVELRDQGVDHFGIARYVAPVLERCVGAPPRAIVEGGGRVRGRRADAHAMRKLSS